MSVALVFDRSVYVIPYDATAVVIAVLVCWWRWRRPRS